MKTNTLFSALCLAAALSCAASAQELVAPEDHPVENRYRIGIDCAPVGEALQVHLHLDAGTGLIVNEVMPGSPADHAGVKRLDILVTANERPVGSIRELVRLVNEARENNIEFEVIRRGEEMKLSVTPEERDEAEIEQLRRGFRNHLRGPAWHGLGQLSPEVQKQLEQFDKLDIFGSEDRFGRGFRRMLPGIMVDPPPVRLPHGFNLNMSVERSDDGPAKIKVQHDGKSWEVTEDHLDELPEEIRPMVESMLNGGRNTWSGLMVPPQQRGRVLRSPKVDDDGDSKQLRKRFDGLELQLQELQNAIRSLREGNEE